MGTESKPVWLKNLQAKDLFRRSNFELLVRWMYSPCDPSSLGVVRFFFGLLMLLDLPEERGGSEIEVRWGDPRDCHFPLLSFLRPLPFAYMSLLYGIMWIGALGIMLGYKFRLSTILFGIPYWYIFLLDKSYWNNHSYLFGIVTVLLMGSSANHFFSLDALFDKSIRNVHVPYWNYFILKFQFFMLYFLAGLKKTDTEWLEGYSMTSMGSHWVFLPFSLFLSTEDIEYLIIHWFGFLLDLTIGFWLLLDFTRPMAMLFCAGFHLMNSRLFSIGMFPYVCLATMPLFCEENWPCKLLDPLLKVEPKARFNRHCIYTEKEIGENRDERISRDITWRHKFVVALLLAHCGLQGFLPYSHFITKGYNNWTDGLYGYSWDMMVHSWDSTLVVIKVVDNDSGEEHFIDPQAFTQNERWSKHADMCLQYAQCLKNNLVQDNLKGETTEAPEETVEVSLGQISSENLSIYIDVWCSLNSRFQQRMYNPDYDLLKARWSPFEKVEWLMPLLSEYSSFRNQMETIMKEVHSWSNYSDVLFIADFPELTLENYISEDLRNITLTVLEGEVVCEMADKNYEQTYGKKLKKGESIPVESGLFHVIHTVSEVPSCYMYTYVNKTKENSQENLQETGTDPGDIRYSPFPLLEDVPMRVDAFSRMVKHVVHSILHLMFGKPLSIERKSQDLNGPSCSTM